MKVNSNIVALRGAHQLNKVNMAREKSLQKLTTGKRINSASDDAAGMAISSKMNNQIRGLKMALRNTQDGQSMVETAEGVLNEVTDILSRMRELCVEASNDTYSTLDRKHIDTELNELAGELDRIAEQTKFNGITLLDGSAKDLNIQVGANNGESIQLSFPSVDATKLNLDTIDVSTHKNATDMIDVIDEAMGTITTERATLGSVINKLEYTSSNISTMMQSLTAANSRIEDTDISMEMINMTKNSILSQSGTSMLSQALQIPNGALQLLQQ